MRCRSAPSRRSSMVPCCLSGEVLGGVGLAVRSSPVTSVAITAALIGHSGTRATRQRCGKRFAQSRITWASLPMDRRHADDVGQPASRSSSSASGQRERGKTPLVPLGRRGQGRYNRSALLASPRLKVGGSCAESRSYRTSSKVCALFPAAEFFSPKTGAGCPFCVLKKSRVAGQTCAKSLGCP
jgi:hypothetical protein